MVGSIFLRNTYLRSLETNHYWLVSHSFYLKPWYSNVWIFGCKFEFATCKLLVLGWFLKLGHALCISHDVRIASVTHAFSNMWASELKWELNIFLTYHFAKWFSLLKHLPATVDPSLLGVLTSQGTACYWAAWPTPKFCRWHVEDFDDLYRLHQHVGFSEILYPCVWCVLLPWCQFCLVACIASRVIVET